jgi:2'-5' RNA ligase
MQGVVTLLDAKHDRLVKRLWSKWKRQVPRLAALEYPHFSFHVAEKYREKQLCAALRRIARSTPGFRVQASGLGVFTGRRKVLYIVVVRSKQLESLHGRIWRAVGKMATGISPFCEDREWIPHITLAEGEISKRHFARMIEQLSEADFRWELPVRNLALLVNENGRQAVRCVFRLRTSRGRRNATK